VLNLIVGDKGSYIYCAFGARITHEDDVDRALAASLELISPPDELAYIKDIQIGITRGQMRVGAYGSPTRRTYGAQGSDVNLASRLMSLAQPGQIIASKRVVDDASNRYEFSKIGPTTVKGIDEPIPLYTLTSMTSRVTTDILGSTIYPIIGREAEKLILNESLGAIRLGRSTTIILTGEAGIGKSRLVEYTLSEAQRRGINFMIALGDEVGRSSLYFAWRPVFMNLFDMDQFSGMVERSEREKRRAHIINKLENAAPELTHLAPLLNEVLMSDIPENDLTKQMTGEVRADNIRIVLISLLSQVAQPAPLLLVVEDAHWLDSASWAMLHSVRHEIHPLLLVIASRPLRDPIPVEFTELQMAANTNHLTLDQFSTENVRSLLSQRLDVDHLPDPILDLVYEKAEGNPFFSEELAYVLRERGFIEIDNCEARISTRTGDLQSLDFPDTSQDVIRSRIDRLAPEEGLALKIASVIGRTFLYLLLCDIHPVEADRALLTNYLDALEHNALTRLVAPEPELTYRFRHNITHEVAYNLMLITQRRELHRSIAEWYERTYKEDLSQFYPLLAHHWNQTDDSVKAVENLERAGVQAVRNFANREAITFLTQALSRADDVGVEMTKERRAQIELLLGEAYVNQAEYVEGSLHLERGLSLLGQAVPKGTFMQVASVLGQVVLQVAHRMLPGFYFGRRSDQRDTLLVAYRALERLVEVYFMTNKIVLSLYTAFRSLNLAEDAGPSPELARGYSTVGALIGFIPLHGMANNYMRRAQDALKGVDDLNAHVWVALTVAFYKTGVGDWEAATNYQNRVVEISEQLGDQRRREDGLSNLFVISYLQGKFETSLNYSEEVVRISRSRGADLSLGYGLQGQAYVGLHQGKFNEAKTYLGELRDLMTGDSKIKEEGLLIEMYGLLSVLYLRRSEPELALETAESTLEHTGKGAPSNYSSFTAYAGPANVYLTLWEDGHPRQDIDRLALKANKSLKKYAGIFPIGEPRYLLYEGWYDWLSGKHDKAVAKWDKSLASAIKLEMVYDQGLAYLEIGRHLPNDNPDRQVFLAKASDIFTDIGAAYDLQRCQEVITNSDS
jgi:tetratricopeptide (TPR) repeat protein